MKLHVNYNIFKKLIDSTNFDCDPISCEVILFPCIIKQDWIAKSRINIVIHFGRFKIDPNLIQLIKEYVEY